MFETRELASSSLGISTRLLSGVRRRVYVRPTSSTIPSTSAIATLSPSRTGWLIAIMTPATKFASVERAANPTTRPSTRGRREHRLGRRLGLVEREQGGDDADEDDDRLDRPAHEAVPRLEDGAVGLRQPFEEARPEPLEHEAVEQHDDDEQGEKAAEHDLLMAGHGAVLTS